MAEDPKAERLERELTELRSVIDRLRTAERQRESAELKAEQYLAIAGAMFVAIGADEKVTLVNPMACEILGCDEDEVVGHNWFSEFLPERLRETVRGVFRQLMREEVEAVEFHSAHYVWHQAQVTVTARETALTIFLDGWRKWPSGVDDAHVAFDDVTVEDLSPPTPTPVDAPDASLLEIH